MATYDPRRRTNAASRVIGGVRLSQNALRGIPSPNAITDTGQGETIMPSRYGTSSAILPPDQNPAYQTALAKGRPARTGYTMIATPSGGTMAVPIGQERKYTDLLFKGNPTADTGFQRPDPAAAYALGNTGAVPTGNTPYERSFQLGYQGGPVQPAPSAGIGYQVGNTLRNAAPGVAPFLQNAASRVAGAVRNTGVFQVPEVNQPTNFGTPANFGLAPALTPPAGINNLVPPAPYAGRPLSERVMFPTGAQTPFPDPNPPLGTVRMGNEPFPGNMPVAETAQYPTAIPQTPAQSPQSQNFYAYNPSPVPPQARRYSDLF